MATAAVVGFIGILLRRPLVVCFIAVVLIASPSALNVVRSDAHISLLALGADIVLEPFQDAADRAVELLSGGERFERPSITDVETEGITSA